MRTLTLLRRNLAWYWRTNLAVVGGVATAVAVLAGALLVGDSVRASLRDLLLGRLGRADFVVAGSHFFRDDLARAWPGAAPLIALDGVVTHESSGRRAIAVAVYGVDRRFWEFQRYAGEPPQGREVFLSDGLAREFGASPGDAVLVRVEKPSSIPLESLHGRKDDVGRTLRLTAAAGRADFSLRPQQGDARAVFVPLERLRRDLGLAGRANTIVVAGEAPERALREQFRIEDLGLRLRALPEQGAIALESESALLDDAIAAKAEAAARALGLKPSPVLAYLANDIRAGARSVPYSLVAAIDMPGAAADAITLNDWTARDLGVKPGDAVSLDYYVWKGDGRLAVESAAFRVDRVTPIAGFAADRTLAPDYPGITGSESLHDWDPPFPLDLKRIRPADEEYWKRYRATPKAFIPIARGQQLWRSRFGQLTSLRITPPSPEYAAKLRAALDPARMGLAVAAVRADGLRAAEGSTDFGEYFVYFSFFLVVSALLLAGLFFKLGVEQRMREIGVLRALGFGMRRIGVLFLGEGVALAAMGAVIGAAAAVGYAALLMLGLRTWWVGAVGTRLLSLHVSPSSLAGGVAGGLLTAVAAIAWTLRSLRPATPRGLLMEAAAPPARRGRTRAIAIAAGLLGLALVAAALAGRMEASGAFFGAGALLLVSALSFEWLWLTAGPAARVRSVAGMGLRNAGYRPGRSVLSIALIASASFLIVSLDAFRKEGGDAGAGGYPLLAESALPLIHNPATAAGREALNLPASSAERWVPFRLKPGDDASCLNLYRPRNPRVLAPPADFLRAARFDFQDAIAKSPNPWLLLEREEPDGAIPAIADANSMTYALHVKLGEAFMVDGRSFRIVASLRDSVFQGELIVSEAHFLRAFPDEPGYRFFLIDAPRPAEAIAGIEQALSDYGLDVTAAAERLAGFHRVENTYLSTFQALGALGLVLGTIGLAAIILRNVLERRRHLAMLCAVGYRLRDLRRMTLAENAVVVCAGLATGALCALIAIAPAAVARGGRLPSATLVLLLGGVALAGAAASLAATSAALRGPLLETLKSE
jgi:ABC-type lipoprotein release transport system permease subunit